MPSAKNEPAKSKTPDLALLKDMVGVQKALKSLVDRKLPLDRDAVLGVLTAQEEVYSREGMILSGIVTALQQEAIGVDDILQAAGISVAVVKPVASGFSVKGLIGKLRPR